MSDEEIESGNKLIAEFIGFTSVKTEHDEFFNPPIEPKATIEKWHYHLSHLIFHSSWDWIMGAVEKIEGLGYGTMLLGSVVRGKMDYETKIYDKRGKLFIDADFGYESKIQSTWYGVQAFIKWHNTQLTLPPSNPMGDKL